MNLKILALTVKLVRPSNPNLEVPLSVYYYLYRESVMRLQASRDKFQLCWLFPMVGDTAWRDLEALLNIFLVWRCRRGLFSPMYLLLNDSLL